VAETGELGEAVESAKLTVQGRHRALQFGKCNANVGTRVFLDHNGKSSEARGSKLEVRDARASRRLKAKGKML
jgi:hypothetical protein